MIVGIAFAVRALLFPSAGNAGTLNAQALMDMPDEQQRYMHVAGVIAGLSTARYVADGHDTGSACIDRWFYENKESKVQIYTAFQKFGGKSPSSIIYALVARACGK